MSSISSGNLRASINVNHQNKIDSDSAVAAAIDAHSRKISITLSDGNGVNQIQTLWHDSRNCPDGGADDLDLNGATIQNVFGEDLDFIGLKAILVTNLHPTSILGILGASANGLPNVLSVATTKILVVPGGSAVIFAPTAAGYLVTPATGDIFGISDETGGAGVIPYAITLGGIRS